jgi:CBS domain-containing protein
MELEQSVRRVEVTALEMPEPVLLDQATPIGQVIEKMREHQTGVAMLTAEGDPPRLTGIFTERDILRQVLGKEGALERPVADLMTADPIVMAETDPIERAVQIMNRKGFRHVPVQAADGRIIACVRHKDIIRFLVATFAEQLLNLPPDPGQVAMSPEGG